MMRWVNHHDEGSASVFSQNFATKSPQNNFFQKNLFIFPHLMKLCPQNKDWLQTQTHT
jgi:hypothetical protein